MVTLTLVRYKLILFPIALLAMAIQRIPLILNRKISFYKLLGSGKGGSFSATPSLRQWALLAVHENDPDPESDFLGGFIHGWWRFFGCETCHFKLAAVASHGTWDSKDPFKLQPALSPSLFAVITRASIRIGRSRSFWKYVAPVSSELFQQKGLIYATGIGEAPWLRQGTFSVWNSLEEMKSFAYSRENHIDVIRKTHRDNWYSEDLYARFAVMAIKGSIRGKSYSL